MLLSFFLQVALCLPVHHGSQVKVVLQVVRVLIGIIFFLPNEEVLPFPNDNWGGRPGRHPHTWQVIEWILYYHGVFDPDVLIRSTLRVTVSLVDPVQHLKPLSHLPDDCVPLVHLMREALTGQCDEERGGIHVGPPIRHGHEALPVE